MAHKNPELQTVQAEYWDYVKLRNSTIDLCFTKDNDQAKSKDDLLIFSMLNYFFWFNYLSKKNKIKNDWPKPEW